MRASSGDLSPLDAGIPRADAAGDVVRDIGAVHTRFAPGFVVDVKLEEGAGLVTFGNGMMAREVIVDVGEGARRLAYSVRSERLTSSGAELTARDLSQAGQKSLLSLLTRCGTLSVGWVSCPAVVGPEKISVGDGHTKP